MADLITLAEYKAIKGLTSTQDDAKIELLIDSISALVKTYCGTTFVDYYSTNKVETFNIVYSTDFVQLSESPIVEIVSVQERESPTDSYVTLTASEYYLDDITDSIFKYDVNFYTGPGAVKVTYKSGYAACPADLKLAVIDLITYYLKEEHKQQRSIASSTLQNQGTSSQPKSADFPDHIKRILDLYRQY